MAPFQFWLMAIPKKCGILREGLGEGFSIYNNKSTEFVKI